MGDFNKSCLLINDDPADQAIFIEAIDSVAPDSLLYMADDAMEALQIMQEDNVVPDYVFVEFFMRGINGLEFMHRLRQVQILKDIPVIVHSSELSQHHVEILKQMGAHAIYQKPFEYWGMCNVLSFFLFQDDLKSALN
jgi:CheY-like chemotaxis protein